MTNKKQRREQIAAMCLQGILASGSSLPNFHLADKAIKCADELIKQLNKK